MGLNSTAAAISGIALMVLLAGSAAQPLLAYAQSSSSRLTINAYSMSDGRPLSMWTTIQSGGTIVQSGFTPLTITGNTGAIYTVTVSNFGSLNFDHWGSGGSANPRSVTLSGDATATAHYREGSGSSSSSTRNLTVNAYSMSNGAALNMYATIQSGGSIVKSGFTPISYAGNSGASYVVSVQDYGTLAFDHWGNGERNRDRTMTLNGGDAWATAHYRTGSSSSPSTAPAPTPPPSQDGIQGLIPKTGAFVALYMYPGGSGDDHWQKVYDVKRAHPSVPIVAVFNPSSGPGWSDSSVISSWVDKLKSAGVIMLGYTYDDYGARSLSSLRGDADKYRNWYGADGLFIDEFTNRAGYENHYRDVTNYAKSIGMKMTMGNPGTDVPRSYIGTVDVINITEGKGYMPLSWLQYCIGCSGSGWHDDYDKRNFAYIRYDIGWLDTAFVNNSANWVGLMYIHTGNDSNGRWFTVPPYFEQMVAELE